LNSRSIFCCSAATYNLNGVAMLVVVVDLWQEVRCELRET
jgi:hypothetical protein